MTKPTLQDVVRMLRRSTPDADPKVAWVQRPRLVTFPTGVRGYIGKVRVEAPGFRTTVMFINRDETGTSLV